MKVRRFTRCGMLLATGAACTLLFGAWAPAAAMPQSYRDAPQSGLHQDLEASSSGAFQVAVLSGVIQSIRPGAWVIAGQPVKTSASTEIRQALAEGLRAKAWLLTKPDGSMLATRLESDLKPGSYGSTSPGADLAGVLQSAGTASWIVDGQMVTVNRLTRVRPGVALGGRVRVSYAPWQPNSVLAIEIEPLAAGSGPNEGTFTGAVTLIERGAWAVAGQTFRVTFATDIDPGLTPGGNARVSFVPMADESRVATRIHRERELDGDLALFRLQVPGGGVANAVGGGVVVNAGTGVGTNPVAPTDPGASTSPGAAGGSGSVSNSGPGPNSGPGGGGGSGSNSGPGANSGPGGGGSGSNSGPGANSGPGGGSGSSGGSGSGGGDDKGGSGGKGSDD